MSWMLPSPVSLPKSKLCFEFIEGESEETTDPRLRTWEKEAEILDELETSEDEEAKVKLAAQAKLLASSREQAEAAAAAKKAERDAAPVAAMVDWPLFMTV